MVDARGFGSSVLQLTLLPHGCNSQQQTQMGQVWQGWTSVRAIVQAGTKVRCFWLVGVFVLFAGTCGSHALCETCNGWIAQNRPLSDKQWRFRAAAPGAPAC